MNVTVVGLWHQGLVTAASLASGGHSVLALAEDAAAAAEIEQGILPIDEPGLREALLEGMAAGRLRVSADVKVMSQTEIVWIAYDTPIDSHDRADVQWVIDRVIAVMPHVGRSSLVLISSQLPVGSTRRIESLYRERFPSGKATFAYTAENLRLGQALRSFQSPDRVVVGIRGEEQQSAITRLLAPFTERIEWMSVESAEMTKHALNSWLGTSVAFINEIAAICESMGADAMDVARGLMSDSRVGGRAYLRPGAAFAGGTLARDLAFLRELATERSLPVEIIPAVEQSNRLHRGWPKRQLARRFATLEGKTVAVLGLAYKPGTNALRQSDALDLCHWLAEQGAHVTAWDPRVRTLPADLADAVEMRDSPVQALRGASAVFISSALPELQTLSARDVQEQMVEPVILDPGRVLEAMLGDKPGIHYLTVGRTG